MLVFIVYSVELTIVHAKSQRVHKVGHPEQLGRGGGSSVLVETLVELSVISILLLSEKCKYIAQKYGV